MCRADDLGASVLHMITRMLDEGADSTPLKAALAGTDFDVRTAAPDVASNLREAIADAARQRSAGRNRALRHRRRRSHGPGRGCVHCLAARPGRQRSRARRPNHRRPLRWPSDEGLTLADNQLRGWSINRPTSNRRPRLPPSGTEPEGSVVGIDTDMNLRPIQNSDPWVLARVLPPSRAALVQWQAEGGWPWSDGTFVVQPQHSAHRLGWS